MFVGLLIVALTAQPSAAPAAGAVRDETGLPMAGAVVRVKDSDRFAVTDDHGAFVLPDVAAGTVLIATSPGFVPREVRTVAGQRVEIVLVVAGVAETVAVSAPESPPPPAAISVTPLDVVRMPGTQADLMRALGTLPGVLHIDEGAGIFVRGGDVGELAVLLDGVVINHPYRYETPTGGFRGAVDPFLTQGASFATGAFSAEYGNSLSAIVDMRALGRPAARQTTITAGLAGVSAHLATPLGSRMGARVVVNKTTPSLLFAVNPSPREFDQLPGGWDASASVTANSRRFGNLRVTTLFQRDHVGVELEKDAFVGFLHSATRHAFTVLRWERGFGNRWLGTISAGGDSFTKTTDVGVLAVDEQETHRSVRATFARASGPWHVVLGTDSDVVDTRASGHVPVRGGDFAGVAGLSDFLIAHRDWRVGVFIVASRTRGRVTAEASGRIDHFHEASAARADPRASLRFALGRERGVRLAAGRYHQAPSPAYFDRIRGSRLLEPMSATHLVVGYEDGTAGGPRFFRLEAYRKWYDDLPLQHSMLGFSSDGFGSSAGVDAYIRRIWPRLELSASGSILRARRRWTPAEQRERYDLPSGTWRPDFEIPYAFQAIATAKLSRVVSVAGSWRTAAGRLFTPAAGAILTEAGFSPVWGAINSERLPRYERVDISISALTTLGDRTAAVFFASVDNLAGRRNTFEMAYSADYSERQPVRSAAPRAFYVGCSITR